MISDDERREVARRLRNGGIARDSKEAYTLLLSCVGIRPQLPATSTYEDAMVRLADLIDRPTCHDTEERVDSFTCSSCGFREGKIMFNPFTYSFRTIKPGWKYCPNCGAEVVCNG